MWNEEARWGQKRTAFCGRGEALCGRNLWRPRKHLWNGFRGNRSPWERKRGRNTARMWMGFYCKKSVTPLQAQNIDRIRFLLGRKLLCLLVAILEPKDCERQLRKQSPNANDFHGDKSTPHCKRKMLSPPDFYLVKPLWILNFVGILELHVCGHTVRSGGPDGTWSWKGRRPQASRRWRHQPLPGSSCGEVWES